jgi:hypothetical protein
MRGDLGVHLANGLPGLLQVGGNVSIAVCGFQPSMAKRESH